MCSGAKRLHSISSYLAIVMGIYGKYTTIVVILSYIQIIAGVLMFVLGIAFRVLVCSWVSDAAFGFWVGFLVFFGGLVGYFSATKDNYNYIGYYLGFNSFSIMFASLAIFCHAIATVYFSEQLTNNIVPVNGTNATNTTNTLVPTTVIMPTTTMPTTTLPAPVVAISTPAIKTTATTNDTNNTISTIAPTNSTSVSSTITIPRNTTKTQDRTGPSCYAQQTWSNYENGIRGIGLGASMMFLCLVEILMAILSIACCWATTTVQPTGTRRKKAIIQGTVSEMLAEQNMETTAMRRQVGHIEASTFNIYNNVYVIPREPSVEATTDEHENDSTHETIPTRTPTRDEPIRNWYSLTTM